MDPKVTIDEAQRYLSLGEPTTALERALHYYHWRVRGGFEPYPGADEVVSLMSARILDALVGDEQ